MNEDIETLVLSGKLFGNQSPSSPARTPSPDSGWHDEELRHRRITPKHSPTKSDSEKDDDGDSGQRGFGPGLLKETTAKDYIGMGPGRTGVKGVIRDRNEAVSRERERQRRDIEEMNYKMEKSTLGGKTYLEEEREKARDLNYQGKIDELILKEIRASTGEKRYAFERRSKGRFGHLREVGVEGFVDSIDEDRGVWVLVHIYDQSLERCDDVDDILVHLARMHPDTKFLRACASALGFACTTRPSGGISDAYHSKQYLNNLDEDVTDEKNHHESEEVDVDLDMLPTLLAYRDGELVHNWVRVDWEAGPPGLKDLLERHKILPLKRAFDGFPANGLSDDDDLQWSDSDGL